jgi:hypothetical protein
MAMVRGSNLPEGIEHDERSGRLIVYVMFCCERDGIPFKKRGVSAINPREGSHRCIYRLFTKYHGE